MRLIQGRHGWWCIGASGVALVPAHLVGDGVLTAAGRSAVAALGVLTPRVPSYYSLTMLTSTNCNLGCPYCFQNTGAAEPGRFNPPRIKAATLRPEVIDSAVAFTRDRMAALGVARLYVLLFGGEPLLNPLGCLRVLRRCAELGSMEGSMISNGVLLRERLARQLDEAGLRAAQITLDGPPEIHDSVRFTRRGGATFDTILANVAAAQAVTGIRFNFRINLTPSALNGMQRLIDAVAAVVDASRCGLGITPILDYGWGFDGLVTSTDRTADRILDAYRYAAERGFRISRPGPEACEFCAEERGRYGAVVNADGTLFSCWESVGRPGYEVGTIAGGYADYAPDKWVSCGSFAEPDGAPGTVARFKDRIDAGLLDMYRHRRQLQRTAP